MYICCFVYVFDYCYYLFFGFRKALCNFVTIHLCNCLNFAHLKLLILFKIPPVIIGMFTAKYLTSWKRAQYPTHEKKKYQISSS